MRKSKSALSKFLLLIVWMFCSYSCEHPSTLVESNKTLAFYSSNQQLANAFYWAKNKALSYAHDASDPVGFWYEACAS